MHARAYGFRPAPGFLAWALLCLCAGTAAAADWYVAIGGSDLNPGTAAQPFATIQHGLDVAAAAGDQVLVQAGFYSGPGNRDLDTGGKAVTVRGLAGAAATTIFCGGTADGFALAGGEEDTTTVIEGFTISAAVVGCDLELAAPRLRDLVVEGATTAGVRFQWAPYKQDATPLVVEDCTFDANVLGLYSWAPQGREYCQVRTCTFTDNGLAVRGFVSLYGCTLAGGGTAVFSTEAISRQLLVNCEISGMAGTVLVPDPEDAAELEVIGGSIHDNAGDIVYARSIESEYVDLTLTGVVMTDNGGGIDLAGNFLTVVLDGCLYARNGGPVSYDASPAAGGAFSCTGSTIVDGTGGGLELGSVGGPLSVQNTIVAFNTGDGITVSLAGAGTDIACCDVYGNGGAAYVGIADPTGSDGNVAADPLFCDRAGGDYSLAAASPCAPDAGACGLIGYADVGCSEPAPAVWWIATWGSDGGAGTAADPFETIGHGVAAAAAGDTVRVLDGLYPEHVAIDRGLCLESASGDTSACIIEAPAGWRVLTITAATDTVTIAGFCLRNGSPTQGDYMGLDLGGGILAAGPPLVVRDCHIRGNAVPADQTHSAGGGVHVRDGTYLRMVRCLVEDNYAPRAGGVCIRHAGGADLYGNVIVGNTSDYNTAGLWILPTSPTDVPFRLVGNTVAANVLTGLGVGVEFDLALNLVLDRNIIAENVCTDGQVGLYGVSVTMDCNLVHPEPGYVADVPYDASANLDAAPWFCNLAESDFRLAATSPAAPGAGPCGRIGALDVGCAIPSGVGDEAPDVPAAFVLHPAHPNPFNPATTIAWDLPRALPVELTVHDVQGRRVRVLRNGGTEGPGRGEAVWRGRDDAGRTLAAGTYLYRLRAGEFLATGKVVLLK